MPVRPPPVPAPEPRAVGPVPVEPDGEPPAAGKAAPATPTGAALHQALREGRDLAERVRLLGIREAADLQRIAGLERQVTDLMDDNRRAEILKLQLQEELQDCKDQTRQCESNLRNALGDCRRWHDESVAAQTQIQELEGRLQRLPPPNFIGEGLGVCEAFLDAAGTRAQWFGTLSAETQFIGVTCYTWDLDPMIDGLLGVKMRGSGSATVRVIADEGKTHEERKTGQQFARATERGVEVRLARGMPLRVGYVHADPNHPCLDKLGAHHAKVLFGVSTKTAIIGSCNYTSSAQCNVEMGVKISLTQRGVDELTRWFNDLWGKAMPHVLGGGATGSGARSPSRRGGRGDARSWSRGGRTAAATWQQASPQR